MQILTVDDDNLTLKLLARTLAQFGHTTVRAQSGEEALNILRQGQIRLVITDWEMPGMNGLDLCRAIRNEDLSGYIYIIMLTGREGSISRREGLLAGADDFLSKPLDSDDLLVCLSTAERILSLETRDLALFAMAKLAESRDTEIGGHLERVQAYARLLAQHLSPQVRKAYDVDSQYIRLLHQTTPLHDLGKVGIPDAVLLKPGKLTSDEFELMKTHAALGAKTLDAALQRFPNARFLQMASEIAATHHEKFDGTGYPRGIAGERIPLCGRIVALADVYDALTSRRVYKEAISHEQARDFILGERGRHFDPDVVDAFVSADDQFADVCHRLRDEVVPDNAPVLIAEPSNAPPPTSDRSILVVEDSPTLLKALVDLLSGTGQTVFPAANGEDAMKLFLAHRPGVVVSDWELPGDSGVELCRQIRRQSATSHVHFIMLTVHSDQPSLLEAYKAGVDDFVGKPFNSEELLARVRVGVRTYHLHDELNRRTLAQQALNAQLAAMNNRLSRLSMTDELTGLYNRRHAMARMEEQWTLAERYHRPFAVAMVDIDHFKQINDMFGHGSGDVVLRQIASILRNGTRATDLACRVGGEEFLILFPSQTVEEAAHCAERCRAAVAAKIFQAGDASIKATVSIGLAGVSVEMKNYTEMLRAADKALYGAKRAGRNRVQLPEATAEAPMRADRSSHG
jgi:putative two-component system response regulator